MPGRGSGDPIAARSWWWRIEVMMRAPEGGELEVEGLPYLKHVVLIDDEAASAPGITGYDEFLKGAERVSEDELKQRQESLRTDEVIKEQGRDHALVLRAGAVADGATPRGGWRLETTSPELLPVLAARRSVGRPVRVWFSITDEKHKAKR